MHRWRQVACALLLVFVAAALPGASSDVPAPIGETLLWRSPPVALAQAPGRAGLVVRYGDGRVESRCVDMAETQVSGLTVLQRSGLPLVVEQSGLGVGICKIGGEGCEPSTCVSASCRGYWAYFHLIDGAWRYSSLGASVYQVRAGAVEGWSFVTGGAVAPPVTSFGSVCPMPGAAATATGTQRPTDTPVPSAPLRAGAAPLPLALLTPLAVASPTAPPASAPRPDTPTPAVVLIGGPSAASAPPAPPTPPPILPSTTAAASSPTSVPAPAPASATAMGVSRIAAPTAITEGGSATANPTATIVTRAIDATPPSAQPPTATGSPALGAAAPAAAGPRARDIAVPGAQATSAAQPPPPVEPTPARAVVEGARALSAEGNTIALGATMNAPPPTATAATDAIRASETATDPARPFFALPRGPGGLQLGPGHLLVGAISLGLLGWLALARPR